MRIGGVVALWFMAGVVGAYGDYPIKPVQLIAQQPPGSQSEAISRIWAECASRGLGQPVAVISKPGANGVIATNYLKLQRADGYTVMTVGMSQMTITPYVYKNLPYDPRKDFDGVAVLGTSPLLLVASAHTGINNLHDIVALAGKRAGGINYGSPGKGSPAHLLTAAVMQLSKADGIHVPFIGEAAAVTALLGGQIDIATLTSGTAGPLVKEGRVIPLAIYANTRDKAFPQVPTIVELTGRTELARPGWLALVVKAGTPLSITKRLREATQMCAKSDREYRARLAGVNVTPIDSSPSDVNLWTDRDSAVFRPIINQLGIAE
jgi:tripartite-type tricarboxylate transporter receptor subunit TctC